MRLDRMLAANTILQERYRIIRQLGQGGMGAVYEALDQRLDTTVALKETLFADERLRKQFEREARLLARLHHPALPRVSDHFSEFEGQFLVMQFISGDDLSEKMAHRSGPFPLDQVVAWADQLLDALDYLHTQEPQIVHRDIKPQNLKVTARGQIILLDFGLAKGQGSEISRVTTSASIFGYTPNYAPLEQIQGLGTDARSDLYSLAATLYHLITGIKPPDALTRAAAIVDSQPDPLVAANELNSSVSLDLAAVLVRGMAQSREQRFATAADMRRALQASSGVATTRGRTEAETLLFPISASAPTRPVVKTPTFVAGETTVVRQESNMQKRRPFAWSLAAVAVIVLGAGGFYAYQHSGDSQLLPATVEPMPTVSTESDAVKSDSTKSVEEEKIAEAAPPKIEQTAKTNEKAARERSVKKRTTAQSDSHEEHSESGVILTPEPPAVEWPAGVRRPPPARRKPTGVTVRTFKDGTQLITSPDGTRMVVSPDGKRTVFRPGEKIDSQVPSP